MDARDIIYRAAIGEDVDPALFLALCTHESRLDLSAIRYEPTYKWLYFAREFADRMSITYDTECALQRFSYSLPQVMGAVLREYGFKRPLQVALTEPEAVCAIACRHLKKLQTQFQDEAEVLAAYNGGPGAAKRLASGMFPNQKYVDAVYHHLLKLRSLK